MCGGSLETLQPVVNVIHLFYISEGEKGNTFLIKGGFATEIW